MLYSCFIHLYVGLIRVAALFGNEQARWWIDGRKQQFRRIEAALKPGEKRFWVHCASLGEFEQGRPLIEALRNQYPDYKIVLTFFSPSGYLIRKNYPLADYIWYLPSDTRSHARRFVRAVQPEKAFFIKYEFWKNYLTTLHREHIPVFLVSANFRSNQVFFKRYGGWYRRILHHFAHLFVQNERSRQLLAGIGFDQVTVTGDTRFDRVCRIAEEAGPIPAVARFVQNRPCIIAGSSWPPDEALLIRYMHTENRPVKWIFAPHEITEHHLEAIQKALGDRSIRFTQWTDDTDPDRYDALIIDNMGMLSSVYQYGTIAYIGGGFGKGIHNILEAAVFGMPVLFGPEHRKFQEALDLISAGGAFPITDYESLKKTLDTLLDDNTFLKQSGKASSHFVGQGQGATQTILRHVFLLLTLFCLITGCSTQVNTPVSRTYHSVTTKYNVLFNAKEHFKTALKNMEEAQQEDYTRLLPLFAGQDPAVAQKGAAQLETAILKAENAITLHSIKAKPRFDRDRMTAEQSLFLSKSEFNPYIDDCYLLIGQSYYYLQDDYNAIRTFDRIAELFPRERVAYEAELWRVRTLARQKDYERAHRVLEALRSDRDAPTLASFQDELTVTEADLYLQEGNTYAAIPLLEQIVGRRSLKRPMQNRIRYILSQWYESEQAYAKATDSYRQVIRHADSYDMKFQARLRIAAIAARQGQTRQVKQDLERMLKQFKNRNRQHLICYALADIWAGEGDMEKAVPLYRRAAAASAPSDPVRTASCLLLADFFFDGDDFFNACAYYDSTMQHLSPDHARYSTLSARRQSLGKLTRHLETIQIEDSLQRVAMMPEAELNQYIDELISQIEKQEQAEQEREALRLRQYYSQQSRSRSASSADTRSSDWYFYNPTTIARGADAFSLRWGRRALEDDWRRSNREVVFRETGEMAASGGRADTIPEPVRITDRKDRAFYLQDLPLTDSLRRISDGRIQDALFYSADLYKTDLQENELAIKQYETLLGRFPETPYRFYAWYALYHLYTDSSQTEKANMYRTLLSEQAPESTYARLLSDPQYYERLQAQQDEAERLYQQTYALYGQGQDEQVVRMADKAIAAYPEDVSVPRFAYIRALSASRLSGSISTLRSQMQSVIDTYPMSEVATAASQIIRAFAQYTEDDFRPGSAEDLLTGGTYSSDKDQPHVFGWYLSGQEDVNQLVFDLINFNIDRFPTQEFDIERIALPQQATLVVVSAFPDLRRAVAYFRAFSGQDDLLRNTRSSTRLWLLSETNLEILKATRTVQTYQAFFEATYPEIIQP